MAKIPDTPDSGFVVVNTEDPGEAITSNFSRAPITTEEADRAIQQIHSDDHFASPVTEDDVKRATKQTRIADIQKAFSKAHFDAYPIPYHYDKEIPAHQLVSTLHCKDFKDMSDDVKQLLYRACLEICKLSSNDFPYPFHGTPLCFFSPPKAISELTKTWTGADRDKLRYQVKKHVVVAAGVALILGLVLGMLLTPSNNHITINVPHGEGWGGIATQKNPIYPAPHAEARITPAIPQPSRSTLIAPPLQTPGFISVPREKGN